LLHDPQNIVQGRLSNIGAKLLIDAASRINEETGDGTTSCTIIAKAFLSEGARLRNENTDLFQFRKGLKEAVNLICKRVELASKQINSS